MARVSIAGRKDLTDKQWRVLQPLLPPRPGGGRPPTWTRRQLLDGIRWRTRAGVPWRDVPERYGHWQSIYHLLRSWHCSSPPSTDADGRANEHPLAPPRNDADTENRDDQPHREEPGG